MSYDDYEDDLYDCSPRAVDLDFADKGYRLCPECFGQGTYMFHKCYPSGPAECEDYCDTCGGEGQVEIELKARISRNKREGLYAGKWLTIRAFSTRTRRHRRTGTDHLPPL